MVNLHWYLWCSFEYLLLLLKVSRFDGPAWTFDEERQQFYYHYYHNSMPDLNLRDKNVRIEILVRFSLSVLVACEFHLTYCSTYVTSQMSLGV
jgi:glycosidase